MNGRVQRSSKPVRVLIVSQWFDPEPTFKGMIFARALQERGFHVRVLTGFPNYPGGKLYDGYRQRLLQRQNVDGITVWRVPLYASHDQSGLRRVMNYLSFAISASVAALLIPRPDVAYVYHPPATVGVVAMVLKIVRGVPYVYDVQDLWPDTLKATGMVNRPEVLRAVAHYMRGIYRSATRVAVLSPGFKRLLTERGVPTDRIDVIPNWTHEGDLVLAREAADDSVSGDFVILYAGNMGPAQALSTVIDAAALLVGERVRFDLIGDGMEITRLKAQVAASGLSNVRFLPRRPATDMASILATADALLVHLRDDPLFEITIPSKTQAYLHAGRPLLMGVRGDAADIVAQSAAGIVFEPESASALADAARRMAALSEDERSAMGRAGRRFYDERLSLRVGADQFSAVLREAALLRPRFLAAKRAFDIAAASVGLVIAAVPMGMIALTIRRRIGRPVLFTQLRPGRDGRLFQLVKFRTMVDGSAADGTTLPDSERLVPLGRILRATSLDELPELWNVLKGDMSIVGPRPLLPRYTNYFRGRERLRLRVRPGITGLAQVNGRNMASWDSRLSDDATYVERMSIRLDLRILAQTIRKVFRSEGVVVDPESAMQDLDAERTRKPADA